MPSWQCTLEKKGRCRGGFGFLRPWAQRTFTLTGQELAYFDGSKQKGSVSIAGCSIRLLAPSSADGRVFAFEVDISTEKLILNAESEESRKTIMQIFELSSKDVNWKLPSKRQSLQIAQQQTDSSRWETEKQAIDEAKKALETERLRQVSTIAAAQLSASLAERELRDALACERAQLDEQKRQIAAVLLSAGAKVRLRAALVSGDKTEAQLAAAEMMQHCLRARLARKHVQVRRKEKERLLRLASVRKIQSRCRVFLAYRRVAAARAARAEKIRQLRELQAQRLQLFYRRHLTYLKFCRMKVAAVKLIAQRAAGVLTMQAFARQVIAQSQVTAMKALTKCVVLVTVTKMLDLAPARDVASSTPFVMITGVHGNPIVTAAASTSGKRTSGKFSNITNSTNGRQSQQLTQEVLLQRARVGRMTSKYSTTGMTRGRLAVMTSSGAETGVVTGVTGHGFVVITVVDKDASVKDDFLGQAVVALHNYPKLLKHGVIELTLPLHGYVVPINDDSDVSQVTVRKSHQGSISITLRLAHMHTAMSGWMWKLSESLMSSGMKRRWFVLYNGNLLYYSDEYSLESPKHVISCKDVTSITEVPYKNETVLKISYSNAATGSNFWLFKFDDDDSEVTNAMWMRKLYRNCSALEDPALKKIGVTASSHNYDNISTSVGNNSASNSLPGALVHQNISKPSRLPLKKRMSVFT